MKLHHYHFTLGEEVPPAPPRAVDLHQQPREYWLLGWSRIEERDVDLAIDLLSGKPMVIDRASRRAWIGEWRELHTTVPAAIREGQCHAH